MQSFEKPSLYDRLGGVYSIATVVDNFIDRIMVDPRLNANPLVDEAHHRVQPAGFKYLVTEMVCWATGGPQKYSGKSMADSHAHLKITGEEWEAFLDDFQHKSNRQQHPIGYRRRLRGGSRLGSTQWVGGGSPMTPTVLGSIVSLWRYPVKSMMGEELNATDVTQGGRDLLFHQELSPLAE